MIDEKKLIKDIEKLSLKDSTEYMACGCTVEQYENDIGYIYKKVIDLIKSQNKVGEWILIEERTPENFEPVDITFTFETFFGEIKYLSSVAKYDGYFWWDTYGEVIDGDVIAWKPRSKPMIKKIKK